MYKSRSQKKKKTHKTLKCQKVESNIYENASRVTIKQPVGAIFAASVLQPAGVSDII